MNVRCTALATLALLSCAPSSAFPAVAWSVSSDDNLYRQIDTETGATVPGTGLVTLPGETVIGCRGLVGTGGGEARFLFTLADVGRADSVRLAQIDLMQSFTFRRGTLSASFRTLAFDCLGTLWGVTENEDGSGEALYRDLVPAATNGTPPTFVMSLGAGDVGEAIAFYSEPGTFYHLSGQVDQVFERIDTGPPPSTMSIPLSASPGPATALTPFYAEGLLLGASLDRLFRVTPSGDVTLGATLDHVSSGLAFASGPCSSTGVDSRTPRALSLSAASPFRVSTMVRFATSRAGESSLRIFDVSGRTVRELMARAVVAPGAYQRSWDGRDDGGAAVPAGVYWIRLAIGADVVSRLVVKLD